VRITPGVSAGVGLGAGCRWNLSAEPVAGAGREWVMALEINGLHAGYGRSVAEPALW